jgi:hypothetical protein
MNTLLKAIIVFAALQLHALSVSAQGVIANDAAIRPIFGYPCLTLDQSVNGYGLFAISITSPSESQFAFSYFGIAEVYALYAVTPGVVIDPAFADATTPLVSNNGIDPSSSVLFFDIGDSQMFGYWDARTFGPPRTPGINDNYGWVLLTRTGSGLQVSSSATAIGGGIIAGTLTQVPEPSAGALTLLGIGVLIGLNRSCSRRAALV